MDFRRVLQSPALLIAVLGAGIIAIFIFGQSGPPYGSSYKRFAPARDPERRLEPLGLGASGNRVDVTAFAGMPDAYTEAVSKYVEAVCSAIKSEPIKRRRFYHRSRPGVRPDPDPLPFPDDANPIPDGEVVVPLVLLPRPEAVSKWANSPAAQWVGWRTAPTGAEDRGSVYGRSLIIELGTRSPCPLSEPAAPLETSIPSWDVYLPDYDGLSFFWHLQKLVLTPHYDGPNATVSDASGPLLIGEKFATKQLGEFITVPAHLKNNRLWWTSIQDGPNTRRFLAYSLLDGNGAKRVKGHQVTADGLISPYVRPLICQLHQPKTKQHDHLLLPVPVGWPPTKRADLLYKLSYGAHETWCLDDWFPAQPHACWVIREAEDSKPLLESFELLPASEKSDRPVFFIAVFAETDPKQLIAELATLYKVSPDAALSSPETLKRLQHLYDKVRAFPLAK